MISRGLGIAILISLSVHVVGLTAVSIVAPEDSGKSQSYTSVAFLGPILNKTAFDIMLENIEPLLKTSYNIVDPYLQEDYLKVSAPRVKLVVKDFPGYQEKNMDVKVQRFLTGSKHVPDFMWDIESVNVVRQKWITDNMGFKQREVVYRSEPPQLMRGEYGNQDKFKIKVKALIDKSGKVKKAEPITTTGFPDVDIIASKFVMSWIFEPIKDIGGSDEWQVVEVVIIAESSR